MPLHLTAAHSSRIRKPSSRKDPAAILRRSASSPFTTLPRTKRLPRSKSLLVAAADAEEEDSKPWEAATEPLSRHGKPVSLPAISPVNNVLEALAHAQANMFCSVPERAGMNSTRIAELLNFRSRMPLIVSIAHVHGLLAASTRTEKEIAQLVAKGQVRKINILGRGRDLAGLGEFLISTRDMESLLRGSALEADVAKRFLEFLGQNPRCTAISPGLLSPSDVTALRNAGFLVSAGLTSKVSGIRALENLPASSSSGNISTTLGQASCLSGTELMLSLPNIGQFLRLLETARTHLLDLLGKSKYREAPVYLLRERWDGAVESESKFSQAKRVRGEFAGVLPGKTKKWQQLSGMEFNWILEECVGAGLVEIFETNSVGHGVRML